MSKSALITTLSFSSWCLYEFFLSAAGREKLRFVSQPTPGKIREFD